MTTTDPLIVPVEVSAWVLNPQTAHGDPRTASSIRAAMEYGNLTAAGDPSPPPFTADQTGFVDDTANHGAYVMWTLPAALRRAVQDPATGRSTYPAVPNRWLVVRHLWLASDAPAAAPRQDAWVVQSDALAQPDGVPYLDPRAAAPTVTTLGHRVVVGDAAPWQEPAGPSPVRLLAVADGNPSFAAYQPFNQNVFSIHDDLTTQGIPAAVVSYRVVGWYSDPTADVLHGATPDELGWTASAAQASTSATICSGQATGIPWQPQGPPAPQPDLAPQVAVGNTSGDAVAAFAAAALTVDPVAGLDGAGAGTLLQAFQDDLLPLLGTPGTDQLVEDRRRAHWFSAQEGGTTWAIVDAGSAGDGPPPAALTAAQQAVEAQVLATLNTAQATVDSSTRQLVAERRRLVELWWKQQSAPSFGRGGVPWGITSPAQLDQAVQDQATVVQQLVQAVATAQAALPTAPPGQPLGPAVAAFATTAGLSPDRLLQAVPDPPFHEAVDPVMVVSGTDAGAMTLTPGATLACRWSSELVTDLLVATGPGGPTYAVTGAALAATLPSSAWAGLPALVGPLLAELLLLDPATAAAGAALAGQQLTPTQLEAAASSIAAGPATTGTVPAVAPPWPWAQPWRPLFLDWEVEWLPIPFQAADGTPSWHFDGTDYTTTATAAGPTTPSTLLARCLLTPKPGFELRSRIEQFITDNPKSAATATLQQLDDVLETVDGWDFLGQAFSGLSTQIALWDPIPMVNPPATPLTLGGATTTLPDLLADGLRHPPQSLLPGGSGGRHDVPPTTSSFEGLRAGQLVFSRLCVVDAFGQSLDVVTQQTSTTYHPLRADGTVPAQPVVTSDPVRVVELPPRLLQPARLDLDPVPQPATGSPILGWVLPNHLDEGLAVYGDDGTAYGELRPATDAAGQPVVQWAPLAGGPYPDLPSLTAAHPDLGGFLTGLAAAGPASFAAFIQAVDETLWTVDPLGARTDAFLSVMLGRPLAVVAATLALELQSAAVRDPSWPFTFADPPLEPRFLGYSFPVRLGDLGYRQDGLLGYFVDHQYATFDAVHVPTPDPYLTLVQPGSYVECSFAADGRGPARALTLLVDPRASIHAACGLLPSTSVTLDPQQVSASLGRMQASFRTGPALVQTIVDPAGTSIAVPSPAERHGTWSWSELDDGGRPTTRPLAPLATTGGLPSDPPTLREGSLDLTGGLDE